MVGVLAKAAALQQQALIDDYEVHQSIAISLAEDLVRSPSSATAAPTAPLANPDSELIELGTQFVETSRVRDTLIATLEAADGLDMTAEAAFEDVMDRLRSIYAHMITMRPKTTEGMRAIASAVLHFEWDGNVEYGEGAIEGAGLAVLVAGLLDKPLPDRLPDWAQAWAA